jgi:hypothetical protein
MPHTEGLAIDRQISLAGKVDFADSPTRSKDIEQHRVDEFAIFAPPNRLDQRAVDVEQNNSEVRSP